MPYANSLMPIYVTIRCLFVYFLYYAEKLPERNHEIVGSCSMYDGLRIRSGQVISREVVFRTQSIPPQTEVKVEFKPSTRDGGKDETPPSWPKTSIDKYCSLIIRGLPLAACCSAASGQEAVLDAFVWHPAEEKRLRIFLLKTKYEKSIYERPRYYNNTILNVRTTRTYY